MQLFTTNSFSSNSEMTLRYLSLFSLWLGPVLCFYSAFLPQSYDFFSLTWAMVVHVLVLLLLSVLHRLIWPGKSRHFASRYAPEWLTLLRCSPLLWLVVLSQISGFLQIIYGHWVEPQTAGQYLILLSDHNWQKIKF